MSDNTSISITNDEIIKHLKLSRQMPGLLREIHTQKIIRTTAKDKNITLSESELQVAADRFRLQHNLVSSQATLEWLSKYQLSVEEFEELIYNTSLYFKLAEHLVGDRVQPYFYAHLLDYTKAIIYEIALNDKDLALELFYGIQEQEFSFWDVAHQYIEEPELRRLGGYRGAIARNQLPPEISAVVFAAQPPQILKPIVVAKKTYLILVEELISPELDEKLHYQILTQLFEAWLAKKLNRKADYNLASARSNN